MKYNFLNGIKINHYKNAMDDIDTNILINNDDKKEEILTFIKKEYERRIEFFKRLDQLEKGEVNEK